MNEEQVKRLLDQNAYVREQLARSERILGHVQETLRQRTAELHEARQEIQRLKDAARGVDVGKRGEA